MTHPEINSRMPYMRFNWAAHSARTSRLTLEERGLFDVVRSELWSVVRCRMPGDLLKIRLRIAHASKEEEMLQSLVSLGLLRIDSESQLYDEVQAFEFSAALAQAGVNAANGKKGGRPKRMPDAATTGAGPAAGDF